MNLEQQVCSLDLAKRLKESEMRQKSYFWWILDGKGNDGWSLLPETEIFGFPHKEAYERISAFTVAELIELLGDKFGVLERFTHSGKFGAYVPRDIGTSATGEKVADVLAELLLQTYGSEGN